MLAGSSAGSGKSTTMRAVAARLRGDADWDYAGPVLPDVELIVAATSFATPTKTWRPSLTPTVPLAETRLYRTHWP